MTPESTDHGYWPDEVAKPGTPAHHHAETLHNQLGMARLGAAPTPATAPSTASAGQTYAVVGDINFPSESAPRPPAIEPSRVMLLDEQEQEVIAHACAGTSWYPSVGAALYGRIYHGEAYANPTDEYVRRTLRKRRLEAEIRRENARLADLDAALVEEWTEQGRSKDGHAATGATLSISRRVYAKLDCDTEGLPKDQADSIKRGVKAMAGERLQGDPMFEGIVRPDFNLNTLSGIFAELIREYDEAQRELPEHERVPRDPQDFLPAELRGLLVIDATPHIQVRA